MQPSRLDLNRPPYRPYLELLEQLRESDTARPRVGFCETQSEERGTYDANALERARLTHVLLLDVARTDLDLIRFLLDAEIAARRADSFQGAGDTLTILSLLLLEQGEAEPDDTWRFWSAKRANFDTFAGGYDIEFVFSELAPSEVRKLLHDRAPAELEVLETYDISEIIDEMEDWRTSLTARYPRRAEDLTPVDGEIWAELFDDLEGLERLGLHNARTPMARARLYRQLERYADAVRQWRAAARATTDPWDRASRLQQAVSDAARAGMNTLEEVSELDVLRTQIPSWNDVGLGRMATEACYELAAAIDDPQTGPALWNTAERWRRALSSMSLVGLQTALAAAEKWGHAVNITELRMALDAEHTRIYGPVDQDPSSHRSNE